MEPRTALDKGIQEIAGIVLPWIPKIQASPPMRISISPRFSLRVLLLVMLVCGGLFGFAARIHARATRQRQILAAVASAGGHVRYDFECFSESRYYAPHRWLAP